MKLVIRNQTCHLLYQNAVFWEEEKVLIIADLHLGKGTVFRKAGIAIPEGITDDELLKLSALIKEYRPKKCIIVGDLIHAKSGLTPNVIEKFKNWLNLAPCEIHLVIGNHDRALLKNLPADWTIHIHEDHFLMPPFYFSHFPIKHEEWFVWAGHVHPKFKLSGTHDSLVLRCFQVFKDLSILPAFGYFVGGAFVKKSNDCKIYVIAETSVIEIL